MNQNGTKDVIYGNVLGELETIKDLVIDHFNDHSQFQTHFSDFLEFDDKNLVKILFLLEDAKLKINSHPFLKPKSKISLIEQIDQVIRDLKSKSKKKDIRNIFGKLKSVVIVLNAIGNIISLANDGTELYETIFESKNALEEASSLIDTSLEPKKEIGNKLLLPYEKKASIKLISNK